MSTTAENSSRIVKFGDYRFDLEHSTLYRGDEPVILPRKRADVLRLLAERAGKIVRKEEIIERVWPDQFVDENNLTLQIFKLRRDLEREPKSPIHILTVPGVGYMLRIDPTPTVEPTGPDTIGPKAHVAEMNRPAPRGWLRSPVTLAIMAMVGIGAGLLIGETVWHAHYPAPAVVSPYTSLPGLESDPAFSPDGTQLVFSSEGETNNNRDIYLKRNAEEQPLRLTDDPDADSQPVWSPTGDRIAFLRRSETNEKRVRLMMLKQLPEPGSGTPKSKVAEIAEVAEVGGGLDWSPDGLYFAIADVARDQSGSGLSLLTIDGRTRRVITTPESGKVTNDTTPRFSPDGRMIAFLRMRDGETALTDLFVAELNGSNESEKSGSIRQLTFDQRRIADLQWMPDGRSIIIASDRDGQRRLWQIPLGGDQPKVVATITGKIQNFDLARKGTILAYTERIQDTTIEIRPLRTAGKPTPGAPCLINSSSTDDTPRFSPDGTRLAFISGRTGRNELWIARADCGNLTLVPTFTSGGGPGSPRWSPDGRMIAFDRRDKRLVNSYLIDLTDFAAGKVVTPRQLKTSEYSNLMPAWSHDGREIYFESSRQGQREIWRENLASGEQSRVTLGSGWEAVESLDGGSLFYTRDNHLWRRDLRTGSEEPLLELADRAIGRDWSVSQRGIYFVPRTNDIRPVIHRYDLETRQIEKVMELGGFPARAVPGLSVTADERLIAVSYISYHMGDIKLATDWNRF